MSLRHVVFLLCAAACAAAHVAILVSVARRAAKRVDAGVPAPRRGLEIFWALLPAVVLALVLTATWDRVNAREKPAELMRVAR